MGDFSKGGVHKTDGLLMGDFLKGGGVQKTDGLLMGDFSKGGVHKTDGLLMGDFLKGGGSTENRWAFDGWFFKGGSTQNRWAFGGFWNVCLLLLKIKCPGRLFWQIRYIFIFFLKLELLHGIYEDLPCWQGRIAWMRSVGLNSSKQMVQRGAVRLLRSLLLPLRDVPAAGIGATFGLWCMAILYTTKREQWMKRYSTQREGQQNYNGLKSDNALCGKHCTSKTLQCSIGLNRWSKAGM